MSSLEKTIKKLLEVSEDCIKLNGNKHHEALKEINTFWKTGVEMQSDEITRISMYRFYMNTVENLRVSSLEAYSVMATLSEIEKGLSLLKNHEKLLGQGVEEVDTYFRTQVILPILIAEASVRGRFGDISRTFLRQLFFSNKVNISYVDTVKEILTKLNEDYYHLKEYSENGEFADPKEFSSLRESNVFGEPAASAEFDSVFGGTQDDTLPDLLELWEEKKVLDRKFEEVLNQTKRS